jgi:3-deoxy-7-phosphoheptulonate synthase
VGFLIFGWAKREATVIVTVEKTHSAMDVSEELRRRGIEALQVRFARQTVFVVTGAKNRGEEKKALVSLAGVERIMDTPEPYQLVHRSFRPEGTRVELGGGVAIGRGRFSVIADLDGEFEEGALSRIALELAHGRVAALMASLPEREGLSEGRRKRATMQGLEQIRSATGLRVGIEVTSESDLSEFAPAADLLRVSGERMQDYRFLRRVGEKGKPVVLVRALSATLEEWLLAAEYVAATGNDQVILCERGIRSFAPETGRVTLDLASVARLNEMTHLPVIVDPLRSTGRLSLGARLARAAVAAGADGIVLPLSSSARAGEPLTRAEGLAGLVASLEPALVAEGKHLRRAVSANAVV